RHTRLVSDWSSDVCSSDLEEGEEDHQGEQRQPHQAAGEGAEEEAGEHQGQEAGEPDEEAAERLAADLVGGLQDLPAAGREEDEEIGRASCRGRGEKRGGGG